MGGHGHHHEPYTVPDYQIYKLQNCPELLAVETALAQKGLKDPWLRYVYIMIRRHFKVD